MSMIGKKTTMRTVAAVAAAAAIAAGCAKPVDKVEVIRPAKVMT